MKQLLQNYKSGEMQLVEVPLPLVRPGGVIYRTQSSLISAGTEKLMIDLAKKGYLSKALSRPDLVRQVIEKIKVDGLADAYKAVMGRLDSLVTLGYSCAGEVFQLSEGRHDIKVGDKIACFGDGFASHSEYNFITRNMFVKIPSEVNMDEAAFAGLGAIALNAIRVANLTFGEKVAVIGLGLLGQLCVQMLKACGCNVIGIDINPAKIELAQGFSCDRTGLIGRDNIVEVVKAYTRGEGADAVIIMAGSQDNRPLEMAAEISRNHGRIVACGLITLNVPRQEFFKKELKMIVSRAAGPGKYDPLYENKGIDYPFPLVRWTTKRNMEYFLELVRSRKVQLEKLISHRFDLDQALAAYQMILGNTEPFLGVLLKYNNANSREEPKKIIFTEKVLARSKPINKSLGIGLVGAGLHAGVNLLPSLCKVKDIKLVGIADAEGYKGRHMGQKYAFEYCVTDFEELLKDDGIQAVFIATRHHLHASMIIKALNAGKHVFVEKPLALNRKELLAIKAAYQSAGKQLMVGFNRRFAPLTIQAKKLLGEANNVIINCRVNAGSVPAESWVRDAVEGGGRIVGEVCHFIDLLQYFCSSLPVLVFAQATDEKGEDNMIITLRFKNGSVANILYASQGDRLLARERLEIFSGQAVCVLDNFKSLFFARQGKSVKKSLWSVDRGFEGEFQAFAMALQSGQPMPVSLDEYISTTLATFAILESVKTGQPVAIQREI